MATFQQFRQKLFAAEEADAAGEGSTVVDAVGKEVGGVEVVVDVDPVFAAGDVVEAAADGPVIARAWNRFSMCVFSVNHVGKRREPGGSTSCC